MKKKTVIFLISLIVFAAFILLEYSGFVWHNEIFASGYSIKGLDVSNHQGDIDWANVSEEGRYKFVFLKATEGNDYKDKYFLKNWNESNEAGILRGAYHYFTTGSSGEEQAQNFISVVPKEEGALPPVVDIEVHIQNKDVFCSELKDFISVLEQYYEQKPILYVMYPHYNAYIKGDFEGYDIWIRDVFKWPHLSDNRQWKLWQYSNRGRVKGINGYVDLNCFNESLDELQNMLRANDYKEGNDEKILSADIIENLYKENKLNYMMYISEKLGIEEWNGRSPDELEISTVSVNKSVEPYTIIELCNPFNVRLDIFKEHKDGTWCFVDYIDFGGRNTGTEYYFETYDEHLWIVGKSCRGYGTGVARYYHDWYELTDEGKKLVLSFPYAEHFVDHIGGEIIVAEDIKMNTEGEMKIAVDYKITKQYYINLDEISDENGTVSITENRNVEFWWDNDKGCFMSEFAVDEDGVTIVKSPEITRQCDEILEKYYDELVERLNEVEDTENDNIKQSMLKSLSYFLDDCSEGTKKTELLKMMKSL